MNHKQVWKRITAVGAALTLSLGLTGMQAFAAGEEPTPPAAAPAPTMMSIEAVYAQGEELHGPSLIQKDYDPATATGPLGSYGFDETKAAYTLYVMDGTVELEAMAFGDGKLTWSVDADTSSGFVSIDPSDAAGEEGVVRSKVEVESTGSVIESKVKVTFVPDAAGDNDATIHVQCSTADGTEGTDYTILLVQADKDLTKLPQIAVDLDSALKGGAMAHVSVKNAMFTTMSFSLEVDTANGVLTGFSNSEGTVPFDYQTPNYVWADVVNNKVMVGSSLKDPDSAAATKVTSAAGEGDDAGWTIYSMGGKPIFSMNSALADLTSVTYTPAATDKTVSKLTVSMSALEGDGAKTSFVDCTNPQELFRLYVGLAEGKDTDALTLGSDLKAEADDSNNSITALYYNVFKQSAVTGYDFVTFSLPSLTKFYARLSANGNILNHKNPTFTVIPLDKDLKANGTVYQNEKIAEKTLSFKLPAGTFRVEIKADGCLPQVGYIVTDASKETNLRVDQILPFYLGEVDTTGDAKKIDLGDRSELLKYLNYNADMIDALTDETAKAAAKLCDLDSNNSINTWDLGVLLQNMGAASKDADPTEGKYDLTKNDFLIDLSK